MRLGDTVVPIYRNVRYEIVDELNNRGYRVIGVATRDISYYATNTNTPSPLDDVDLTCEGFIAFQDPPKVDTDPAIVKLISLGVEIKVLTGNSLITTIKVCRDIGILDVDAEQQVMSGADLAALRPAEPDEAKDAADVILTKKSPSA